MCRSYSNPKIVGMRGGETFAKNGDGMIGHTDPFLQLVTQ